MRSGVFSGLACSLATGVNMEANLAHSVRFRRGMKIKARSESDLTPQVRGMKCVILTFRLEPGDSLAQVGELHTDARQNDETDDDSDHVRNSVLGVELQVS